MQEVWCDAVYGVYVDAAGNEVTILVREAGYRTINLAGRYENREEVIVVTDGYWYTR